MKCIYITYKIWYNKFVIKSYKLDTMKKLFNLAIVIALSVLSVCAFNTAWSEIGTLLTLGLFVLPMLFFIAIIVLSKKGYLGLLPLLPLLMIVDKQSDAFDVFVATLLLGVMVIASAFALDKK